MTELLYTHQGRQYTKAELEVILKGDSKPRAKSEGADRYHRGYRIVGHKQGAMERAKEAREFEIARYRSTSPKERSELGLREPRPWDEIWWRNNAPKTTIKAVDLYRAAEEAADLARRYGWQEVEIVELKKGDARGLLWGEP